MNTNAEKNIGKTEKISIISHQILNKNRDENIPFQIIERNEKYDENVTNKVYYYVTPFKLCISAHLRCGLL